ncbi:hypothetical protein DER29_2836 [Micromonospora sp. M71_S20]|nr:hypothetical protein DER29_2836 [Micromonospora sp. M71_S20]
MSHLDQKIELIRLPPVNELSNRYSCVETLLCADAGLM